MTVTVSRSATIGWLAGVAALLASWGWYGDPAHTAAVPALLGRVARPLGHGGYDDGRATWWVEGFPRSAATRARCARQTSKFAVIAS